MPYNTKALLTDNSGLKPVPQGFDPVGDQYQVVYISDNSSYVQITKPLPSGSAKIGKVQLESSLGEEPKISNYGSLDNIDSTFKLLGTASYGLAFNGSYFDRVRNNTQGTLLASAARTAGIDTATQTNHNAKGVILFLNVTAASGTGGLVVRIQIQDTISNIFVNANVAPLSINSTGIYAYELYPSSGAIGTAGTLFVNQRTSGALTRMWRASVTSLDSSSYTYSLGYALVL